MEVCLETLRRLTDGYGTNKGHTIIDDSPLLYKLVLGLAVGERC